jgi:hypothetical protein
MEGNAEGVCAYPKLEKKANTAIRNLGMGLTLRLSDAGMRRRKTKLIYPNHRLPPWLAEDATRDLSNRDG